MDAKITLSFDKAIIERAKRYAESQNMSLSRMMELILDRLTSQPHTSLEDFPISDWVNMVAEGPVEYVTTPKSRKKLKDQYHTSKKSK